MTATHTHGTARHAHAADHEAQPGCPGAAIDHDETGVCNHSPSGEHATTGDLAEDIRASLAFHKDDTSPSLAALRDALLDQRPDAPTPHEALAAAEIILAAYTRELVARVDKHRGDQRALYGLNRSTRGWLTGMHSVSRLLDRHAVTLERRAEDNPALKHT